MGPPVVNSQSRDYVSVLGVGPCFTVWWTCDFFSQYFKELNLKGPETLSLHVILFLSAPKDLQLCQLVPAGKASSPGLPPSTGSQPSHALPFLPALPTATGQRGWGLLELT